ncbi:Na+/H+ antiporter NhaC [Rhodococcus sp. 27YEA15]|uniref:Na+/H+ antiporter NhaC family protein n=1 Tax=Rhodococcus sp. 27YEA15 TaxID=3156259 RepID=UPI003C79EA25
MSNETSSSLINNLDEDRLTFRIGRLGAYVAPIVFGGGTIILFLVLGAFDLTALAVSGLVGLLVASAFARSQGTFWEAAVRGLTSPTCATLVLLMPIVGIVGSMLKNSGISDGFIWLSETLSVPAGLFPVMTFVITCCIAMATGSAGGTLITLFPLLYPAGAVLGASPVLIAGAIISGALFGDNLAPLSDTTIISASTQRYRRREGIAEVSGVVRARSRYSLSAAAIATVLFAVLGMSTVRPTSTEATGPAVEPGGLLMLVAVVALLVVAFWKKNLFAALGVALAVGIAVGLFGNLFSPADIIGVTDSVPSGFLVDGAAGMMSLVAMLLAVFAIVGVAEAAGVFDDLIALLTRGRFTQTPLGAELSIGAASALGTIGFAGANGPALLFLGPIMDRVGAQVQLHPYRRSNVMDCFAMGVGSVFPFASYSLFLGGSLTVGFAEVESLSPFEIFPAMIYPFALTVVILVAVLTGWGRRFEGPDGKPVKNRPAPVEQAPVAQEGPRSDGDKELHSAAPTVPSA